MATPTFLSSLGRSAHARKTSQEKKMAKDQGDNSLYPIAVLIDELRNDDVNVSELFYRVYRGVW